MDASFLVNRNPPKLFNYLSAPDEQLLTKTILGIEKYKEAKKRQRILDAEVDKYEAEANAVDERRYRETMRSEKALPARFGRNGKLLKASMLFARADRPSVARLTELSRLEPDVAGSTRLFEEQPVLEELREIRNTEAFTAADANEQQRMTAFNDAERDQQRQIKAILRNKAQDIQYEERAENSRATNILHSLERAHKEQGYDWFDFQQARRDLDI